MILKIDKRFKWAAMNESGNVFLYVNKPKMREDRWFPVPSPGSCELSSNDYMCASLLTFEGDWKDSLHEISDSKFTKFYDFTIDQKVFVSDFKCHWSPRHYSHTKDGVHYTFPEGKTSWTTEEGEQPVGWTYIKPYHEEITHDL